MLLYFERVINLFAAFGGLVSFESFNLYMAVGYYLFLLSILVLLKKREKAFL